MKPQTHFLARRLHLLGCIGLLLAAALAACKPYKPEPPCRETLTITERNGQRVLQAVNGVYLKENFPVRNCVSKPYSDDPYKRNYVQSGSYSAAWYEGKLFDAEDQIPLRQAGKWPAGVKSIVNLVTISFPAAEDIAQTQKSSPVLDWWFQPAIPHQRYPIDLLPNFGLDVPDPQAGVGPVKSKPTVYWAVRGSQGPNTPPYTTFCSMKSPPDWDGKNYSPEATKEKDVSWLIQAETSETHTIGNTCRGYVSAGNGKPVSAMIDVPGSALKDIDKIYKAASQKLSELTVD